MSEDTRNALNALLYHTGSASQSLMMVLSTNRAEVSSASLLQCKLSIWRNGVSINRASLPKGNNPAKAKDSLGFPA